MPQETHFHNYSQALIEQTGQAFFAYDTVAHQFTFTSPAFRAKFVIPEELSNSVSLLALVHPEDRSYVVESLEKAMSPDLSKQFEFRIQFPGQSEQWVCLTASVVDNPSDGRLIIGHAEDITAQRQYNDHLKKFSNKKNAVLHIMAHDLAGPLGMIHSLSEVLSEQVDPTENPDALEMITLIGKTSKKGSALIRDFINQEFLESSQTDVITRRVNLVEKLQEIMEDYQGPLTINRVAFQNSSDELYAEVDDLKLMQALTNLISNSLKFTPQDGTITVSLQEEDHHVLITVADTGVGIPAKFHTSLFDRFTEARRPGLNGEPSVGLGMSIIKTIVEWHKGEIWFESEENKGTSFFIRVPKESK